MTVKGLPLALSTPVTSEVTFYPPLLPSSLEVVTLKVEVEGIGKSALVLPPAGLEQILYGVKLSSTNGHVRASLIQVEGATVTNPINQPKYGKETPLLEYVILDANFILPLTGFPWFILPREGGLYVRLDSADLDTPTSIYFSIWRAVVE